MKMTASHNSFLTNTVNINPSRLKDLNGSVEAVYSALVADDELGPLILGKDPQGSWAHKTIIKPVNGNEFDADFMLHMSEQPDWAGSPSTYIAEVHAALTRNGTYATMVKPPKCRCIRVVYAGDYHVDIVPIVRLGDGRLVIVNSDDDDWEDTDPAGFTRWMKEKNGATNGNLKQVIRMMKYLRDHHGNFKRTRSVILTALIGERVDTTKPLIDPSYYEDVPTTLVNLLEDLNAWLQANPTFPSIPDPSGATDPTGQPVTFDHRWKPEDYANFSSKIATIAADARAAYDADRINDSLALWQRVFGSDFEQPSGSSSSAGASSAAGAAGISAIRSGRGG